MSQTILLVEDNEDDVFAFKWAFKKAQIPKPLQVVTDGQQALDYLFGSGEFTDREAYPLPYLMFLDLKLPYINGHEILECLRDHAELDSLPVVILSGSDEIRDHERAARNGAQAYLVKPATPDQLAGVIASFETSMSP
jgi:CheY-like chemotaxis protein